MKDNVLKYNALKDNGWEKELTEFAHQFEHPAWGFHHAMRVYTMALQLAHAEHVIVDEQSLYAAACLHDIGAYEEYRDADTDHAERSAQLVPDILRGFGFPEERIPLVRLIIEGHMFYHEPDTHPESLFFHDADALDFMGVIGVTRMLSIVGLDDWAPDLDSAVRLLKKFCAELPEAMATSQAQIIAAERRREMEAFIQALSEQTFDWKHL